MHEKRKQIYLFINFLYHTLNAKCAPKSSAGGGVGDEKFLSFKFSRNPSAGFRKTLTSNLQSPSISSRKISDFLVHFCRRLEI